MTTLTVLAGRGSAPDSVCCPNPLSVGMQWCLPLHSRIKLRRDTVARTKLIEMCTHQPPETPKKLERTLLTPMMKRRELSRRILQVVVLDKVEDCLWTAGEDLVFVAQLCMAKNLIRGPTSGLVHPLHHRERDFPVVPRPVQIPEQCVATTEHLVRMSNQSIRV